MFLRREATSTPGAHCINRTKYKHFRAKIQADIFYLFNHQEFIDYTLETERHTDTWRTFDFHMQTSGNRALHSLQNNSILLYDFLWYEWYMKERYSFYKGSSRVILLHLKLFHLPFKDWYLVLIVIPDESYLSTISLNGPFRDKTHHVGLYWLKR